MEKQIKKDVLEESVLIASSVKWVVLSSFAGITGGIATAGFLKLLEAGTSLYTKNRFYFLFLPATLFLSSFIMLKLAPDGEKKGRGNVIRAIHNKSGRVDIKFILIRLTSTLVTLISGGSAGKEGPCAQIGASVASFFSDIFHLEGIDRKRFVICGVAAGVAGVFGTPIAGAIFAVEVIYVGRISYLALLPSLIASYISFSVNKALGIKHLGYYISIPQGSPVSMFIHMIIFGIFIGIISMLFIVLLTKTKEAFAKVNIYKPCKGIIGGIVLIVIVLAAGSKNYLGLGTGVIGSAISGNKLSPFSFLFKMLSTSVTFGSGGTGGILTPLFFIGSAAGNAWAQVVHGNIGFYSAIGMAACFSACANTPITGIIMAMELFGSGIAPYVSVACVISYLVVGHRSVYPSQLLAASKTPSLSMETNCEIGNVSGFKLQRNFKIKKSLFRKNNKV